MRADAIVGALWGDEGKGKLVGAIGHGYDAVLRVNASTNAGHTVQEEERVMVTRQLPSVFFPDRTLLVVGPGALVNLPALAEELAARPDLPQLRGRVRVASSVALVIRPYIEKGQGGMSQVIGSTHQGTGPTAVARAARHALHLWDVAAVARAAPGARQDVLERLERTCAETAPARFAPGAPGTREYAESVLDELVDALARLEAAAGPVVADYTQLVLELQRGGGRVLIEGCNGLLLDNLHGAHPHVTSASTNLGAMLCGANLPPSCLDRSIVVAAAYATCLGKRPFPTAMTVEEAEPLRARCDEVDPAQLQPRRLGWLDLPALRKALAGCAGAELHLNKLDALAGLPRVKLCVRYRVEGRRHEVMPDDPRLVHAAEPEWEELDGWPPLARDARTWDALPGAARAYVRRVEALLPPFRITSLGTGPRVDDLVQVPR